MDVPWGSPPSRKFVTNVGLITSDGPWGPNITSLEWTHHVSYRPGLIIINTHKKDATTENILKTREFGVNLASETQNIVSSIAGNYTGREVNKIAVLRDFGIKFYRAKEINVFMLNGAALNLECKLKKYEPLGDHIMFIGEVVQLFLNEKAKPIVYHGGRYWKIGKNISKPPQQTLDKLENLVEKHKK